MALKIVTDSACDLPEDVIKALAIEVFPILVYVNGEEYLDCVTMKPDELYQMMSEGATVKTAQIPLHYFMKRFEEFAKTEDSYIYLAFSSNLSGTHQTSLLALQEIKETYQDADITVIDTKCASLGLGILVEEVARKVKEGMGKEAALLLIGHLMTEINHVFSVDDLEYLFRGGRVSRSQAMIGNILNIKPILNVQDGFLIPIDRAKGKKKLLSKLYDYIKIHGVNLEGQTVGIAHTQNEVEALAVKAFFNETFGTENFIINQLGCAVGAHCGPGMIAIFFKGKNAS